jgi:hypothetical protein
VTIDQQGRIVVVGERFDPDDGIVGNRDRAVARILP